MACEYCGTAHPDLDVCGPMQAAADRGRISDLEAERDELRDAYDRRRQVNLDTLRMCDRYVAERDAALAEVARLQEALTTARREALEEAAQIADDTALEEWNCYHPQAHELVEVVAARIRVLATLAQEDGDA